MVKGQQGEAKTSHLVRQLLRHDLLCVGVVQVGEIHESLSHVFVPAYQGLEDVEEYKADILQVDAVCILHELPHHLALVVLHHQHLLRLGHTGDHHQAHLQDEGGGEDVRENGNAKRMVMHTKEEKI